MPYPDWPELPVRLRRMLKLYTEGYTYREVAKQVSYHRSTVWLHMHPFATEEVRKLHRQNYRGKQLGKRANVDYCEIRRLYSEGLTIQEMAERHGVSRQAISYRLKPLASAELAAKHKRARQERQLEQPTQLMPRFLELIQANAEPDEIRATLGIFRSDFGRLLDSLDEVSRRRWQATHRGLKHHKFSDGDMESALREAAALNGGRIGRRSYDQLRLLHPHWPSGALFVRRGGWNRWVEKTGLPANSQPANMGLPTFSYSDYRRAAAYVYERLGGRIYSMVEYDRQRREIDPGGEAFRVRFGGGEARWLTALEELLPKAFDPQP